MASDYDAITRENIRRRGEEFDDIGRWISEQFYTDRTHFIYELLQNAEDALARRSETDPFNNLNKSVLFRLYSDRLEVSHFGQPFNEDDVVGISDILRGTKKLDYKQIGKFGIGFKSVYAFTTSPEVHSGEENFRIERYIRPKAIEPKKIQPGLTLFVLPFNHPSVTPNEAFKKISIRLSELGLRTLLFLRQINEITWEVNGETKSVYLRDTKILERDFIREVRLIGQKDDNEVEERWLVFEKPVYRSHHNGKTYVEIAFLINVDKKTGRDQLVGVDSSPLFVYFPTDKETRLRFLIQGHYNTTPARDNISQDDRWNLKLIKETANLIAQALLSLRDNGLLDIRLLDILPIRSQEFPSGSLFHPIYSKVASALRTQPLLPTCDGGFVSAHKAKLSRGSDLRLLISDQVLPDLFGSSQNFSWLSDEITEIRTPDLRKYLMEELKIEEIDGEKFAKKITLGFLQKRDDDWMAQFYGYLDGQKALWRPPDYFGRQGVLRNKPIIRLETNEHVVPFSSYGQPNAYLPPEEDTDFPIVKKTIIENEDALRFLKNLGLKEPDIVDEIVKKILPKYKSRGQILIDEQENLRDVRKIVRGYETAYGERKSVLRQSLITTAFIRAINASNPASRSYQVPQKVYDDTPELRVYLDGNADAWFVDYVYFQYRKELGGIGISSKVKIHAKQPSSDGNVILANDFGYHKRGLNGFDPDCEIEGLEFAVTHPTFERSLFIWNKLLVPNSSLIKGVVQQSARAAFDRIDSQEEILSSFGKLLVTHPWLPDKSGVFYHPYELSLDELPEKFIREKTLEKYLNMKTPVISKLAMDHGVEERDLALIIQALKQNPNEVRSFIRQISGVQETDEEHEQEEPSFDYAYMFEKAFKKEVENEINDELIEPIPVEDSDTRRERTMEEIIHDILNEPARTTRFKKAAGRVWEDKNNTVRSFLKAQYGGRCQVCSSTFPKRDGEPYFEGLYLISRTEKRWIDRPGNVLCLCPTCCAKFLFGSVEAENIIDQIESLYSFNDGGRHSALVITLCGEEVEIHFSERHLIDLQELIRASKNMP